MESTATLKRRPRSSKSHPNGSDFILQESSTVKRRPKSRDKEPEGYTDLSAANGEPVSTVQPKTTQPVPYQNGTATVKRCQPSDAVVSEPQPQNHPQQGTTNTPHRDSVDHGAPTANEGGPLRKPKPPVSPKPVVAQIKRQGTQQNTQQAVPNKKIPLPGPGTPGSPGTDSQRVFLCTVHRASMGGFSILMGFNHYGADVKKTFQIFGQRSCGTELEFDKFFLREEI